MIYYAIKRKKDGKFVGGNDFRFSPPHPIMANEKRAPLLLNFLELGSELFCRNINLKEYEVVKVRVVEADE